MKKFLLNITLIIFSSLITHIHVIKCPDYFNTYVNPGIMNFLENSKNFPQSVLHCPEFKQPDTLCCKAQEYLDLSTRFTSKYYKTYENLKLLAAYTGKLANSLTGISE